jgi:hypothetical protein
MHQKVLVIGEEPEQQVKGAGLGDWAGIGGRYTGHLVTVPGATTARVYGDTVPAFEAAMAAMSAQAGTVSVRPANRLSGVDQVRRRELVVEESELGCAALLHDGEVRDPGLTEEEQAAMLDARMLMSLPEDSPWRRAPEDVPNLMDAGRKCGAFEDEVAALVEGLDPGTLLTVVDVHAYPAVRYFHTTDAAEAILRDGFRDGTGSYGFITVELEGVFIADTPVDVNEGAKGDQVLAVDLPGDVDLDEHEIVEELKGYREWCVPARLLNERASVRLLTEGELDDIPGVSAGNSLGATELETRVVPILDEDR